MFHSTGHKIDYFEDISREPAIGKQLIVSMCWLVEGESTADDEEGRHSDAQPQIVVQVQRRRRQARCRYHRLVGVVDARTHTTSASILISTAASVPVQSFCVRRPTTVAVQLLPRRTALPPRLRLHLHGCLCAAGARRRIPLPDRVVRRCR